MSSTLILRQYLDLPPHPAGNFDHGDVYLATGQVFIANTAAGSVEVVDGAQLRHLVTIPGCPEASGVLVAQQEGLVFAAARGAGKLLIIDSTTHTVLQTVPVGPRPNGLAWDLHRQHLLVADVQENRAHLVDPQAGAVIAQVPLPGRPRWAVYHQGSGHFLVNIREPACVAVLSADPFALVERYPISSSGPHGWTSTRQAAGRLWPAMEAPSSRSIWPVGGNSPRYRLLAHRMPFGTITVWIGSTWLSRLLV